MKTSFIIFVLVFTVIMSVGIQVHAEDNFTPADQPQVSSPNEPQYSVDPNASTAPAKKAAPAPAAAQSVSDAGGTTSKIMDFLNRVLFAIAYFLGTLAMTLFSYVVLISSYNDFVTSEAVNKGWVLVRDMCNMFFVVILLIIAFAQILRVEKYSMKTLLPKVLIAAVLVNFSKLVCGLLIDFAQVIMMTFVNGYQATAGANLVVGLGFTKLLKMSAKSTTTSVDPGYSNADIFLTLAMGVVFLVLVIVVTFLILVLLTVRIVTLWILVVLSPFAFLLSDLPFGQSYATEWWKKFGEQVVIGPFLAFFLWLSLLIMSNPDQMITQDIRKAQEDITKSTGGAKQESMQLDNLAQFFIGLAMLLASFEMAQRMGGATAKWAGKVSGMSKSVGKKLGKFAGRTAYKVTGAKAVVKRGQAAYGGFMAKQKSKQEEKMKKWQEVGESVYAGKEAVVKKGKQAARTAVETAKIPKWFSKEGRQSMKDRIKNAGMMETVNIDKINQSHREAKMKQADDFLAARGIKSPDELSRLVADEGANNNLRRSAAMKLADKGLFKDLTQKDKDGKDVIDPVTKKPIVLKSAQQLAESGKELLQGDRASSIAFGDALEKKQMNLAYRLADGKGKDVLAKKLQNGDMDIRRQDDASDKDEEYMNFVLDSLGAENFSTAIEGRAKAGNPERRDNIKNTVSSMAKGRLKGMREDAEKTGMDHKTKDYQQYDAFRKAVANVTGDLVLASQDSSGKVDDQAAGEIMKGSNTSKLMNLNADSLGLAAKHVKTSQMKNLANSTEAGAQGRFEELTEAMVAGFNGGDLGMVGNLSGLIDNEVTHDALPSGTNKLRDQIEGLLSTVKAQALKNQREDEALANAKTQLSDMRDAMEQRKIAQEELAQNAIEDATAKVEEAKRQLEEQQAKWNPGSDSDFKGLLNKRGGKR